MAGLVARLGLPVRPECCTNATALRVGANRGRPAFAREPFDGTVWH